MDDLSNFAEAGEEVGIEHFTAHGSICAERRRPSLQTDASLLFRVRIQPQFLDRIDTDKPSKIVRAGQEARERASEA